jgi:hypothetical protein
MLTDKQRIGKLYARVKSLEAKILKVKDCLEILRIDYVEQKRLVTVEYINAIIKNLEVKDA